MWRLLAPLILLAAGSCGGSDPNPSPSFTLTSTAFGDGQPIPAPFTCDGADRPPPLGWSDPPPGTRSFAVVMDDPDAPGGTWRHWAVFDIPSTARSDVEGRAAVNDFGRRGYGGPCPPKGHGPHHYRFRLYALDIDRLALPADPKVTAVEEHAGKHSLASALLTGTYERR